MCAHVVTCVIDVCSCCNVCDWCVLML